MAKSSQTLVSRRAAIKGMLAGVAIVPAIIRPGFAQANRNIVLATWGGDYAKLLTKHVSGPVLGPRGWTVINDEAQRHAEKGQSAGGAAPARGYFGCSSA